MDLIYGLYIDSSINKMIVKAFGDIKDKEEIQEISDLPVEKTSLKDFEKMINNKLLSDFKFIFPDKKEIYSHKFLLVSRSTYFEKLFSSGMSDSNSTEMVIENSYDVFYAFITYLYTDKIIQDVDYIELITLFNFYGCSYACSVIEKEVIKGDLNEISVLELLEISNSLNLILLRNHCLEWIMMNIKQVLQLKEIENLSDESKKRILLASNTYPFKN